MAKIADVTHWQKEAKKVIWKTLQEWGISPKTRKSLSFKDCIEIEAKVSKAYPFGKRAKYPYRVWLQTVNVILTEVGVRGTKNSMKGVKNVEFL